MDALKIGRTIAFLRKRYNMTQKNVANALGVSDKAVSKWERGLGMPDVSLLGKLGMLFDTDIESILEGNLANMDLHWCGMVEMRYAENFHASTLLYDKPIVYFQLSYIMLAGIRDIYITGNSEDVSFLQKELRDGASLGLHLRYRVVDDVEVAANWRQDILGDKLAFTGIMLVNGLDFIYGKDVTKIFRRIIYNEKKSVQFEPKLHLSFLRRYNSKNTKRYFERGIFAFPMDNCQDLLDAGTIVNILERRQGIGVADLKEIALRRGFI